MALIGNFPPATTSVFNLDFLPEKFLLNFTNSSDSFLNNFSVVTSGVQLMSITSKDRLTALAKFDSGAILRDPRGVKPSYEEDMITAQYLRLATGRINKATTITGTSSIGAGGSSVNAYAASTNISNVARRAVEQSINPSANATFDNFEALIIDPTNLIRAQVTFSNGFSDEYSVQELAAMYANYHVSDGQGYLGTGNTPQLVIDGDSGAGLIAQVVLYNGSGGSTIVLKTDYVQL